MILFTLYSLSRSLAHTHVVPGDLLVPGEPPGGLVDVPGRGVRQVAGVVGGFVQPRCTPRVLVRDVVGPAAQHSRVSRSAGKEQGPSGQQSSQHDPLKRWVQTLVPAALEAGALPFNDDDNNNEEDNDDDDNNNKNDNNDDDNAAADDNNNNTNNNNNNDDDDDDDDYNNTDYDDDDNNDNNDDDDDNNNNNNNHNNNRFERCNSIFYDLLTVP